MLHADDHHYGPAGTTPSRMRSLLMLDRAPLICPTAALVQLSQSCLAQQSAYGVIPSSDHLNMLPVLLPIFVPHAVHAGACAIPGTLSVSGSNSQADKLQELHHRSLCSVNCLTGTGVLPCQMQRLLKRVAPCKAGSLNVQLWADQHGRVSGRSL